MLFNTETFQNKFNLLEFMTRRLNDHYKSKINHDLIVRILEQLERLYLKYPKQHNFQERLIVNYDIDYFNGILIEHDLFDIIVCKKNVYLSTYTETKVKLNLELEKSTGTYEDIAIQVSRMIEGCLFNKGETTKNA